MGLDGVELVMALEEAFGVELKNDEVVKTVTPGLVTDLIFSKLRHATDNICHSQRAFYVLRQACARLFHTSRKTFTPATSIRILIPQEREAADWVRLQQAVEARRWPKLDRPLWLNRLLTGVALGIVAACVWFWWRIVPVGPTSAIVLGCICAIFPIIAIFRLTRRFKTRIPADMQRIRDLVPYVSTANVVEWTREQVAQLVKIVVQEQLGISDARYREDAHFINDFGMD